MNEKLKSMLEKAGASTSEYYRNLDNSASYSKSIVNGWSEDFREQLRLEPYLRVKEMDEGTLEKFAELIVRECIKESLNEIVSDDEIAQEKDPLNKEYLKGNNQGIVDAVVRFRNHFGVSE